MTGVLLELYRHKTWATLRLIEFCQTLSDEHLDATIPGTFGTIRDTLRHLVSGEAGYFRDVTGEDVVEPLPDGPAPLEAIADRLRILGARWEVLALDLEAADREITTWDGWKMAGAIPMAQAIHHADDHRTQILSILGARGLDVPDLSVWSYAESAGLTQAPPARPGN